MREQPVAAVTGHPLNQPELAGHRVLGKRTLPGRKTVLARVKPCLQQRVFGSLMNQLYAQHHTALGPLGGDRLVIVMQGKAAFTGTKPVQDDGSHFIARHQ
ncbi:hypothetical protein AWM69_06095 [Pseudomonas sp. D1HM]|nr:hypothetical protein [Pseudomonas sp. D1HM]